MSALGLTFYLQMLNSKSIINILDDTNEQEITSQLELSMCKSIMPANDYLIHGNKNEKNIFEDLYVNVNKYFSILEEKHVFPHTTMQGQETISKLKDKYVQIKTISDKIFNLASPIGNIEGARLMEEMDLIMESMISDTKGLHKHNRQNILVEIEVINTNFYRNILVMLGVFGAMIIAAIVYRLFLTKSIIAPIERSIEYMGYVATGDFGRNLDIKTNDEIGQLASSFNDMTLKLQKSNKQLEESEKHKRELLNSLKDCIYQCESDINGVFTWVNIAGAEMFGYKSPEEMIGTRVNDIYANQEDRVKIVEILKRDGIVRNLEVIFKKINADCFYAERTSNIVKDEEGIPIRIEGIIRDITERKKAEDQIHKLSHAVEQSSCSIVITDDKGIIEYINPKFTKVTGYTLEETVGKNPSILKSGKQSIEVYREMWETITSGKEWRGEFYNKKKNGELFWEYVSMSPVKNEEGVIINFMAIKEDITRRKQIEEELMTSHKMSSIGRLSASVFHEILNPVNIISAHTQLLLMQAEKGSNTEKDLQSIQCEIGRIVNITDNLLMFSGKEDAKTEKVEVNGLLENVLTLIMPELNIKKIKFITKYEKDLPEVMAHGSELREAFLKLITNSIEAMPSGGTLTVKTQFKGDFVEISLEDTGCGIVKKDINRIFEPFYSTKKEIKRVGLGLSTVYAIIEGYGGRINVESEKRKGTTVVIDLPVKDL